MASQQQADDVDSQDLDSELGDSSHLLRVDSGFFSVAGTTRNSIRLGSLHISQSEGSLACYDMSAEPRGLALIIEIDQFDAHTDLKPRAGSAVSWIYSRSI
jgi:hypothetical protein